MTIDKWKCAVVHLECATDSVHFYDRIKEIERRRELLQKGEMTPAQFAEGLSSGSRDIRVLGTALFLSHVGRRYLLTARHVVWDEHSAKRELEEELQRGHGFPPNMQDHMQQTAKARAQDNIFNIIFRVPSLDEVLRNQKTPEFLMNLGAGASFTVPFTFSEPSLDLALISLDQRNGKFADELVSLGFVPVPSEDIADGPDADGQEVFTIGFPGATALLGQVGQHPASAAWSSSYFSLPVASFGRVSMSHDALPFFWVDMSIYPGNSGGPVVADGRLVGVVSTQATLPTDDLPSIRHRIPFGRIIKTKFVRSLLATQEEKDRRPLMPNMALNPTGGRGRPPVG
jgi:hypothetical protein